MDQGEEDFQRGEVSREYGVWSMEYGVRFLTAEGGRFVP